MPIKFSTATCLGHPTDKGSQTRVRLHTQCSGTMTLDELARHIESHHSVFSRPVIIGVMAEIAKCLREQLLEGNRVELGDLGAFQCSLRAGTAASEAELLAGPIDVSVVWDKGRAFRNLTKDAVVEQTLSREAKRELRKQSLAQVDEAMAQSE